MIVKLNVERVQLETKRIVNFMTSNKMLYK